MSYNTHQSTGGQTGGMVRPPNTIGIQQIRSSKKRKGSSKKKQGKRKVRKQPHPT